MNEWEEIEEEEYETPTKNLIWLRIVALMTVAVFGGMIFIPVWNAFKARVPSGELVEESYHLKENINIELLNSVVKIRVISKKGDTILTAGQKTGTGFNISKEGVIITNHHVIDDAYSIAVTFPNGTTYKAKRWASKVEYDLAVIQLDRTGLPAVPLNLDNPPEPGDGLMVIGNPMDLNNLMVAGRLERYVVLRDKPVPMLCLDVPIYPGNSGSPVFDTGGKVVAVVFGNLRVEEDGNEKTYGLAIPIKEILALLE